MCKLFFAMIFFFFVIPCFDTTTETNKLDQVFHFHISRIFELSGVLSYRFPVQPL